MANTLLYLSEKWYEHGGCCLPRGHYGHVVWYAVENRSQSLYWNNNTVLLLIFLSEDKVI